MGDTQADIDSLLAQAQQLAGEAAGAMDANDEPVAVPLASAEPAAPSPPPVCSPPDPISRILHLEVPVIVKLAECQMPVSRVVGLSAGAIIEFEKPADAPLDLMINNKCIGIGQAVKVGENFGLRITHIGTLEEKIRALGK